MSPSILSSPSTQPGRVSKPTGPVVDQPTGILDRSVFPDGLRTSGQHSPIPALIHPYESFPKEITGPTVWKPEDYQTHPDRWTHPFSPEEIAESGQAADQFIASQAPLTAIAKESFPLPTLGPFFYKSKREIIDGRGFISFKGIPVNGWSNLKCAVAYLGLSTYFGYFLSQNAKGHISGHVQNSGEDQSKSAHPIRIYRTNKRQFFHTDSSDIVGLLCMAKAESGGESDIASTHHIFNTSQREHPDVVETFTKNNWYFDRKGEWSEGEEPYYKMPVFMLENEEDPLKRRVYARYDPMGVTTSARYNEGPEAIIPPLSAEQKHAIEVFEETAGRLASHMVLDPGDIQLSANSHVFHARTAYTDWPQGAVDEQGRPRKQRQLMRSWSATPEDEGGWKSPFADSKEKKRGGVQRDDTPPHCPLGAE